MRVEDWRPYRRRATLERVIDGDTIQVRVDQGFRDDGPHLRLRLARINAPEGSATDATRYLRELLPTTDRALAIETLTKLTGGGVGEQGVTTFERWVAEVWFDAGDGWLVNSADALVAAGLATYSAYR